MHPAMGIVWNLVGMFGVFGVYLLVVYLRDEYETH